MTRGARAPGPLLANGIGILLLGILDSSRETILGPAEINEFPIPTESCAPAGITSGPDGALWFAESVANKIGRITTAGEILEFSIPAERSRPTLLAAGPDGAVWFTAQGKGQLGRLDPNDGTFKTVGQGSLQVIDRNGNLVRTLMNAQFEGSPWDLTINDQGGHAQLFVSNVVRGTVVRIDLNVGQNDVAVMSQNEIADGYAHHANKAAFVLGPTGLAFDQKADTLYVASTLDNAVFAVTAAETRTSPVDKGDLVGPNNSSVLVDPHSGGNVHHVVEIGDQMLSSMRAV